MLVLCILRLVDGKTCSRNPRKLVEPARMTSMIVDACPNTAGSPISHGAQHCRTRHRQQCFKEYILQKNIQQPSQSRAPHDGSVLRGLESVTDSLRSSVLQLRQGEKLSSARTKQLPSLGMPAHCLLGLDLLRQGPFDDNLDGGQDCAAETSFPTRSSLGTYASLICSVAHRSVQVNTCLLRMN